MEKAVSKQEVTIKVTDCEKVRSQMEIKPRAYTMPLAYHASVLTAELLRHEMFMYITGN